MNLQNPRADLADWSRRPDFTPSVKDVGGLLDLLESADVSLQKSIQAALARVGDLAAPEILARLPNAQRPVRGLLVKILGRICQSEPRPDWTEVLLAFLYDDDLKARRNAIIALGHLGGPEIERALLRKWEMEDRIDHRRSIASSLGKVGGRVSLEALRAYETNDDELKKITGRAVLMISRNMGRGEDSGIDASVAAPTPVMAVAYCRSGLETILVSEFDASWNPRVESPGRVCLTLSRPLKTIFRARTMMDFALALPPVQGEMEDAIVRALTTDLALRIFKTWTKGPIRYRIELADAGHRRSAVWKCAKAVSEKCPELINDPRDSTWEAVVRETETGTQIDLRPRKINDARFSYRVRHVPAASHPPLAAALARIAEVRPGDVVWDPFCGSGTELVERARLGPCEKLHGTDVDPKAIHAARQNLAAAKIADAVLETADALTHAVPRVSLIITNPPMGRRVRRDDANALLNSFIRHAADMLVPGGRLVWVSPFPEDNLEEARKAGLKLLFKQDVDMGGFEGQIQKFERPKRHAV